MHYPSSDTKAMPMNQVDLINLIELITPESESVAPSIYKQLNKRALRKKENASKTIQTLE